MAHDVSPEPRAEGSHLQRLDVASEVRTQTPRAGFVPSQ